MLALGRYRMSQRLGAGTAGTVFVAVDERTGRDVVVKLFDGAVDGWGAWLSEMRLALRVSHPNVVRCLDGGHDAESGLMALVFDRVTGGSLRRRLVNQGPLDDTETWALLADVASGLAEAHRLGVLHRDIKPENVLYADDGHWRVTDFGAGRFLSRGSSAHTVIGSDEYMAPEVLTGDASFAADLFSLGVVGFEARAGRRPTAAERHSMPAGDDALWACLHRLMADEAGTRFANADVVARIARRRSMQGYTQRAVGSRVAWRLDDEVGTSDGSAVSVGGASAFVHALDATTPVVMAQRRVTSVDGRRRTLAVVKTASRVASANATSGDVWVHEAGQLSLVRDGRTVAAAPVHLDNGVPEGGWLSLQPVAGELWLVAPGSTSVMHGVSRGAALTLTTCSLAGPVVDLRWRDGAAFALVQRGSSITWEGPLPPSASFHRPTVLSRPGELT